MPEIVTVSTTRAQGIAMAEYDVVGFHVTISELGKNAAAAKEALKKSVAEVTNILATLKDKGLSYKGDSYKTTSAVAPEWDYSKAGKTKIVGQKATWQLQFQTSNMEMVNDIYDALTSVELTEIYVAPPSFKVDNITGLHKSALEDAWMKVKDQFATECRILDLDPRDYQIQNWNVHYDNRESAGPRRMASMSFMESAAGRSDDDSIDLNPGKSVVGVNLTVAWMCK